MQMQLYGFAGSQQPLNPDLGDRRGQFLLCAFNTPNSSGTEQIRSMSTVCPFCPGSQRVPIPRGPAPGEFWRALVKQHQRLRSAER